MANPLMNSLRFMQQVRSETRRIVWPNRRETGISTVIVLVLAAIACGFFFVADQFFSWAVGTILAVG